MREFFKGWRRKLGFVVLLIALVTASGWLRSKRIQESVCWTVADRTYIAYSASGRIYIWNVDGSLSPWPQWKPGRIPNELRRHPLTPVVIGYWFVILPACLLAAYLIVWNGPKKPHVYLQES